jgi:hypothetical protein
MWMLILLAWSAVFSLLSVGLLLTKSSDPTLSTTELSAACQNGVLNGITTNLTRISEACSANVVADSEPESEVTLGTVFDGALADGALPGLALPIGWTGTWNNGVFDDGIFATFTAVKGIYETCNACGGLRNPPAFNIVSREVSKAELMNPEAIKADYVEKSKADDAEYTNIAVTSSSPSVGTTIVTIDGTASEQAAGGHNGAFHIVRYTNATKYIELTFREEDGATNADWLVVKKSLDWSTVK